MTRTDPELIGQRLRHQTHRAWLGLVALTCVALLLVGCGDFGCKNTEQARVTSPDGKHDAVVFQRDCGATTHASTHVSIVATGELVNKGLGNTLVTDWGLSATPIWSDDSLLTIRLGGGTQIIKKHDEVDGITVHFEETTKP